MNLDSERTHATGGGIFEIENLDRFTGDSLCTQRAASHPRHAGLLIADDFTLAPGMNVDVRVRQCCELALPAIVMTRSIIPMTTIRRLKLDSAEGVANRVSGSPDKYGGCVVPNNLS